MVNTIENKTKFLAQYWDQDIIKVEVTEWSSNTRIIDAITIESDSIKQFKILLKPLSSIIDEDVMYLMKIIYPEFDIKEILYKKDRFIYFISQRPIYHISMECLDENSIYAFDYLRSKGYALPWMGLSVENQVKYGWIKLV